MTNSRNHSVDTIKGLLIIFVVVGHSGVILPKGDFFGSGFISIFGRVTGYNFFHMPAFFIIGGLYVKDIKAELKSLFPLAICYVFWLLFLYRGFLYRGDLLKAPCAFLISNWDSLHSPLWFIPALLTFKIIHSIMKTFPFTRYPFVVLGLIVVYFADFIQRYHAEIPWGIDVAMYMIPISLAINFVYKNELIAGFNESQKIIGAQRRLIMLSAFCVFTIFLLLVHIRVPINTFTQWHLRLDLAQFSVPGFEGFFYLFGMMLCMVIFFRCEINENILSKIGKKTLPVYIFHYPVLKIMGKVMPSQPLFSWFFSISMTVAACILVSIILLRINSKFRYIGA